MPRGVPKKAAKSGQVTRAELIRQTAKKLGKTVRPRDIIAALKEQGVTVSHSLVTKTLKRAGFKRKAHGTKAAAAKHSAAKKTAATAATSNAPLRSTRPNGFGTWPNRSARKCAQGCDRRVGERGHHGIFGTGQHNVVCRRLSQKASWKQSRRSRPTGEHKWFHCGSAACGQGVRAEGRRN